jgi:hypothetical protein
MRTVINRRGMLLDLMDASPLTRSFRPEKMKAGNFFAELKRRNVYKVAIA